MGSSFVGSSTPSALKVSPGTGKKRLAALRFRAWGWEFGVWGLGIRVGSLGYMGLVIVDHSSGAGACGSDHVA